MHQYSKKGCQNEYTVDTEKQIGQGRFGRVYLARGRDKEPLACKVIRKADINRLQIYCSDEAILRRNQLFNEWTIHARVSGHKNIVTLHKHVQTEKEYLTFMEMCEGDLARLLSATGGLPQAQAMSMFSQILDGYSKLHSLGIAHRDLKPQNILLNGNTLKICDFGYACQGIASERQIGSMRYMAPQLLSPRSGGYDPHKCDIWSLGIILYKMLYGKEPYVAKSFEQMITTIANTTLSYPAISKHLSRLLSKMMLRDPEERLSFEEVYRSVKAAPLLLVIYANTIDMLGEDSQSHATLRELKFNNYSQSALTLMNLLHEKRKKIGVDEDVLSYEEKIYSKVRVRDQDSKTLEVALLDVYYRLEHFEDYKYSIRDVQIMLMSLMVLLLFECGAFSMAEVVRISSKIDSVGNVERLQYMETLKKYVLKMESKRVLQSMREKGRNKSFMMGSTRYSPYNSVEKRK